jgi:transcriptional accessory protein Tex/SPT6
VVNPGDRVTVRVLEVKLDKNQIALTMRSDRGRGETPSQRPQAPPPTDRPRRDRPVGTEGRPPAKSPFNNPFAGLDKLRRR